jgi:cysteine desulfurase
VPGARVLGRDGARAPHVLALAFPGLVGEALVDQLDLAGVAASTGAACTVLGTEASPVLPALGLDEASVQGSLRLSLGWSTTAAEVAEAGRIVGDVASRLATMRPKLP